MVKAVKVVEASMHRTVWKSRANGWPLVIFPAVLFRGICTQVTTIQMPFANHCGVVSLLLQESCNRWTIGRDQAGLKTSNDVALQFRSPAVSAGHDSVAGGRAD